ncbi:MAG TPA: molybdopterin cofactor-binding domain-containing protein, partial [Solimonas sp.]|nr:molybdopterin cofactor-binding domain-containing protein [Solimonas sp.]
MNDALPFTRRDVLKAGAAGGLVIGLVIPAANRFAQAAEGAPAAALKLPPPNAFLRIGSDDSVTVQLAHSEMGQGIWTALPMLVAEELDADWSKLKVEHAAAAPVYAHTIYGMQMTGGSSSTWSEFERYRQAGAMARALLLQAAAQKLGVSPAQCRTEQGQVICGEKRLRYGELAEAAAALPAPKRVVLKEPKDWKLIGKATKRLDTPEKITGRAQFGMDVQFEGLKTAVVARPPVFGASVKSLDASKAKAVPGVRAVVQVPSGVAVVADHFWAAKLGRDALAIDWNPGPHAALDSEALMTDFRRLAGSRGRDAAKGGNVAQTMQQSKKRFDVEYQVPYLAHAPMEPLNCTVKLGKDRCEIWTGTQFQTLDQMVAAQITGLKPEQVQIHTTFLGGGFGRRATPTSDFVSEAVHVAKASGLPVKTVWTREDDIRGGYYRPAYLHRVRVGVDSEGRPQAWHHSVVGQSIIAGTPMEPLMIKDGIDLT